MLPGVEGKSCVELIGTLVRVPTVASYGARMDCGGAATLAWLCPVQG